MNWQLSSLSGQAGELAVYDVSDSDTTQATVLIVHGLGEHAGRYTHVADALLQAGFGVRAYDHQGHGRSAGRRGTLHTPDGLLQDLCTVIDDTRRRLPHRPLVLLGHSMGGLVVARAVAQQLRPVDALVMSSPALGIHANPLQKLLLSLLPDLLPHLTIGNGLDPQWVARDAAVVQAYRSDPLVHDRISPRLGAWIWREGPKTLAAADRWPLPTLLLYAGTDKLVDPAASDAFAQRAPADRIQAQRYEAMYHEVFNDPERAQVLTTLTQWLQARFAA
ncbi:MAG: Phospholipase YtpA [Pseudomonadota bacterium]|jgi:alpha-beta hydrolase superfamily lysophospholipase